MKIHLVLKNGVIFRSLGDVGTNMVPSFCWDLKLSNEGPFVEIRQETTKLGRNVWKKSLESLRAEYLAVCMQRWSFRRRSLSWETSFDWSEMRRRAFPGVTSHLAVRTWPGFQIKRTPPDFSWFFMRTIPVAENRGEQGPQWTTAGVADLYVQFVLRCHGLSWFIDSDGDPRFTPRVYKNTFSQLGVELKFSIANHPQTNGVRAYTLSQSMQAERKLRFNFGQLNGHGGLFIFLPTMLYYFFVSW